MLIAHQTAQNPIVRLIQMITRPHPRITDIKTRRQTQLLSAMALVLASTSLLVALFLFIRSAQASQDIIRYLIPCVGITVLIYAANYMGYYRLSSVVFVVLVFITVHFTGILTNELTWLFFANIVIILTAIFFSYRTTLILFLLSIIIQWLMGTFAPLTRSLSNFTALMIFIVTSSLILTFMIHRAQLERERRTELEAINQRLRDSEAELERRVAERTRDLIIAANVSRQVSTILELDDLLPQVVTQTREAFDFYYVAIFLYNASTDTLGLYASSVNQTSQLHTYSHTFSLSDKGLIPKSARTRQSVLVNNIVLSPDYEPNPHLELTQSELCVPIMLGGKFIGVLDLQSEIIGRFTDHEQLILQSLAEQVGIAVENARLYGEQRRVAEELRSVDDLKSQFLASMSHELRTPLNAILNFSKFISMGIYGAVTPKQQDALTKILGSADHLLALINDVLDVTKIEAGMMQLFVEADVDPNVELRAIVATAEMLLSHKSVTLIQDIDANLPLIVGDRRRIRQILLNLVSNACKFTDEGSVTIRAKACNIHIEFVILDTGPGIAAEDLAIIFEPFQQTEFGIRHAGGTGLGLPISKKLIEAHQGRLWVETTVGQGSAFYVNLPIRSPELLKQMEYLEKTS